ncbi:hypothetical protein FOA43_002838 [Brettanomyces nanus]|uniref:Uncharacterized protein n=1 Tax=Eeniella nana TaxID=13502 RepID=A0A875S3L1_EENNA|nr:uncharacterized protein FOA43_002838 [Brettanomyces nanus]QPG75483.1 hypothetical protein FOA43_002838 [Brettanomyces nanus]
MTTTPLDSIVDSIISSIETTSKSVDSLIENIDRYGNEYPELVRHLKQSVDNKKLANNPEGMSLLSLKNSSLLGYLNSIMCVIGRRLGSVKQSRDVSIADDKEREKAVQSSVVHRVTLDKGIKPLEKKLSYQLEKLIDAYRRREHEQTAAHEKKSDKINEESELDDEDEDEALRFRPNASALINRSSKPHEMSVESITTTDKYRPPKISAALPPSTAGNDGEKKREGRQRNLQSMDEYLQDIGDAPEVEESIGATITNSGRDIKTKKQMEKEQNIQRYEEDNFVRLPAGKSKESKRERSKRMRDEFFGEDWSMFDNNRDIGNTTTSKKRRKKQNAWQKAKRSME